ncbi:MAG: hypothetical protein AVDCRST_MAG50-569, partial [uncultured Acidimicrobiales bacterium]
MPPRSVTVRSRRRQPPLITELGHGGTALAAVRQAVDVREAVGGRFHGSVSPPLLLALRLLAVVLGAGVATVVALVYAGPLGGVRLVYAVPALAALYAAAGLVAWWRRPANQLGALLVV